jgi:hypothetical protein
MKVAHVYTLQSLDTLILAAEHMDYTYAPSPHHMGQRDVDVLWNLPWAGHAAHLPEDFSNLSEASGA